MEARLRLVSDSRRRLALSYLTDYPAQDVPLQEVADFVQATIAPSATEPRDPDRVALDLHHSHLPIMAETTLVEYDPEGRTVRYEPDEFVEQLLDLADAHLD